MAAFSPFAFECLCIFGPASKQQRRHLIKDNKLFADEIEMVEENRAKKEESEKLKS